jgi:hypothetical protein
MAAGRCEVCGKWSPVLHKHHFYATRRFIWKDPLNEADVCPFCHNEAHNGDAKSMKQKCLEAVAARESMTPAALEEYLLKKKWGRT